MTRRTMPYHRRYHEDALQGYRRLSLEQRGAYTTLLDLIYDNGGPIDNNDRWLAGELCVSIRKARALISELLTLQKIYLTPDGKISNHRAEKEIGNALEISRKRSENGLKRGQNTDEKPRNSNKINQSMKQMRSNCSVIPIPEPYNKNLTETFEVVSTALEEVDHVRRSDRAGKTGPPQSDPQRLLKALADPASGRAAALQLGQARRRG